MPSKQFCLPPGVLVGILPTLEMNTSSQDPPSRKACRVLDPSRETILLLAGAENVSVAHSSIVLPPPDTRTCPNPLLLVLPLLLLLGGTRDCRDEP